MPIKCLLTLAVFFLQAFSLTREDLFFSLLECLLVARFIWLLTTINLSPNICFIVLHAFVCNCSIKLIYILLLFSYIICVVFAFKVDILAVKITQ